jgi:DNA replication protein DnaC
LLVTVIDDLRMRKLPSTAAENLLEIVMRRYERASTLVTPNRPVEDREKLRGDSAAGTAMLDRLLHHGHVLKCGPRSWRTKMTYLFRRQKAKTTLSRTVSIAGFEVTINGWF